DLSGRLRLATRLAEGMARELRMSKRMKIRIADQFRDQQRELAVLLSGSPGTGALGGVAEILDRRTHALGRIADASPDARAVLGSQAGDHAHLCANRLLRSSVRMQEVVLYEYLRRLYESLVARTRKAGDGKVANAPG